MNPTQKTENPELKMKRVENLDLAKPKPVLPLHFSVLRTNKFPFTLKSDLAGVLPLVMKKS